MISERRGERKRDTAIFLSPFRPEILRLTENDRLLDRLTALAFIIQIYRLDRIPRARFNNVPRLIITGTRALHLEPRARAVFILPDCTREFQCVPAVYLSCAIEPPGRPLSLSLSLSLFPSRLSRFPAIPAPLLALPRASSRDIAQRGNARMYTRCTAVLAPPALSFLKY